MNSIVVQDDGRMVIGGGFETISGEPRAYLARLGGDGELDGGFPTGTDGTVWRLLQQPDGRILVAGDFTNLQGVVRLGIGRILTNGLVDTDFDAGTLLETLGTPTALAVQPDGKVIVGAGSGGRLFRLNSDGGLDDTFVQTNVFGTWYIYSVHVRTNGTLLVGGGFDSVNGLSCPGLALLGSDGVHDTGFVSPLDYPSTVFSIVEHTNGNLFVGGSLRRAGSPTSIVLGRLHPDLNWDTGFSTDPFVYAKSVARAILLQPDDKIIVAGHFSEVGGYWRRGIARLDPQGRVDPCFDPRLGLGSVGFAGGDDGAFTVARQTDGRILIGGAFAGGFDGAIGVQIRNNIARLLPASECDGMRVYHGRNEDDSYFVAGTCPPGGTNHLQSSTNLIDWVDIDVQTGPYLYTLIDPKADPVAYFRVELNRFAGSLRGVF